MIPAPPKAEGKHGVAGIDGQWFRRRDGDLPFIALELPPVKLIIAEANAVWAPGLAIGIGADQVGIDREAFAAYAPGRFMSTPSCHGFNRQALLVSAITLPARLSPASADRARNVGRRMA